MIDLEALALVGARIELRRILELFPSLRDELLPHTGTPEGSRHNAMMSGDYAAVVPPSFAAVRAAVAKLNVITHTCEACGEPYVRTGNRQRFCTRPTCIKARADERRSAVVSAVDRVSA